jgi:hypothetical protein
MRARPTNRAERRSRYPEAENDGGGGAVDDAAAIAFLSQAHVEPDITMEIFFVDRPLDGFGALELVEPE